MEFNVQQQQQQQNQRLDKSLMSYGYISMIAMVMDRDVNKSK